MTELPNNSDSNLDTYFDQPTPPARGPVILFKIILFVGVLLLVSVAFLAGRMFSGGKTAHAPTIMQEQSTGTNQVVNDSFKAVSDAGQPSVPIISNNELLWIPLSDPHTPVSGYSAEAMWAVSGWGFADRSYGIAPDFKKVAVLTVDNQLIIASSDGTSVTIPGTSSQTEVYGWSPDSQKLLFHTRTPNLRDYYLNDGEFNFSGGASLPVMTHIFDMQALVSGYYVVDLPSQSIQYLPQLTGSNVRNWIDSSTLLVEITDEAEPDHNFMTFDITTATANPQSIFYAFQEYFSSDFSFSADGKRWSLALTPSGTVDEDEVTSTIEVADFPQVPGTVIKRGRFAMYQDAQLSPDGEKLFFEGRDGVNQPRYIHLYADGVEQRLFEGRALQWIDNNQFIYGIMNENASNISWIRTLKMYDLTTQESTDLYQFPTRTTE